MPTATAKTKRLYRVIFSNHGHVYEVYAKSVSQGSLFGCVEVEGLLFGEKTSLAVAPAEDSLQREFSGVERSYIPPPHPSCRWKARHELAKRSRRY